MPFYLTQWRDGSVSLTVTNTREEALEIFGKFACLDDVDIYEMETKELSLHITLSTYGKLQMIHLDPALDELRRVCFPELTRVLDGSTPGMLATELKPLVKKAAWDAMEVRRESQLSRKLRRAAKKK